MKLHFYGAAQMVTGSNYLLEIKTKSKIRRILVDCGMFQGAKHGEDKNYEDFPYDPKKIDAVLVTHAHVDHIGRIPKLYKQGFRNKILVTEPTKDLSKVMLLDSQGLLAREARREKKEPLYSKKDVEGCLSLMEAVKYDQKIELFEGIHFRFKDAGHILGSAMIEIWAEDKKIVFSGDVGNQPVPLLSPPTIIKEADYVVVESTYGDRIHQSSLERKDELENAIEDTITKGGTLMIPAFALERSQELLCELNSLVENHRIPQVPVFIDSPMAIRALEVYKRHKQYYNQKAAELIKAGDKLFDFPGLTLTRTTAESKQINDVHPPKIILAGSGMSTGGRILHHEIRYLPDPKSCLLIVSYQVPGSLGRRILDGSKKVKIFNEMIPVRAEIRSIDAYSSHADQQELYNWLRSFNTPVKRFFAVHGEEGPALNLVQLVRDRLGIDASAPMLGDVVEL